MNILHIGKFYPPFYGGMETYLCDLARAQAQQGHQVTVLVHNHQWRWLTSKQQENMIDGVRVIRQRSLRPILFAPLMLGLNRRLKRLLTEHQPDLVHLHWPNPSLFTLLLNKATKRLPWVVSWHSDMVTENSRWLMKLIYRVIRPLEKRFMRYAHSLLVSTQAYADHSAPLLENAEKTQVIPLGLNTDDIEAIDANTKQSSQTWADSQWQPDQFRLFHLGRLTFYKNQQMLVQAMAELKQSQLIIVGEGQLESKLNQQIQRADLQDQVTMLGSQSWPNVHALYASCDVFCMASHDRAESFGVVLLEAMYHNKIILVPDTVGSGMRWLAENYPKGFVYQSNNPDDFAEKVRHIQNNQQQIEAQSAPFKFSIDAVADQIEIHCAAVLKAQG